MSTLKENISDIRNSIRTQEDERGCYMSEYSTTILTRILDALEANEKKLEIAMDALNDIAERGWVIGKLKFDVTSVDIAREGLKEIEGKE